MTDIGEDGNEGWKEKKKGWMIKGVRDRIAGWKGRERGLRMEGEGNGGWKVRGRRWWAQHHHIHHSRLATSNGRPGP